MTNALAFWGDLFHALLEFEIFPNVKMISIVFVAFVPVIYCAVFKGVSK